MNGPTTPLPRSLQRHRGAVRRYARAMKLGAWLQGLPHKLVPAPFRLLQMGSAFWQSRALAVAARLDVAAVLGDEALPIDVVAQRLQVQADPLCRLLRLLAAAGVFEERGPRVFANNAVSVHLRDDHAQSVRALVLMHNSPEMSRPWYESLEAGVRTGQMPFALSHGQALWDHLGQHPGFEALFARAMDQVEALTGQHFATDLDWGQFDRVMDLGGSLGAKAQALLAHHPRLQAVVVDRAAVIAQAQVPPGLQGRLRFEAGDLREGVPPAQGPKDIYLLSAVLHGMGDADARQVLTHLGRACAASGARVAVLELVMPEHAPDLALAAFDLQMFMGTPGRERSLTEWQALWAGTGLELQERVGLQSLGQVLVLRAPSAVSVA